ncbi:hypothetical protein CDD83_1224 [Cordyceps sp. RAO-2017]|nr:hypothetical protein CDD83_1224 [Cordyceps sp. RAO-2017]
MTNPRPISSFSCLTLDCYGTIIDWESGIWTALEPLRARMGAAHTLRQDRLTLLGLFTRLEGEVQRTNPGALYSSVLAETYGRLAADLGVAAPDDDKARFGAGVGDWPAFPDSVDALRRLHKPFRLVVLSNVDRESFQRTLDRQLPGIEFDAIYTAQDIGSYKPDSRNFAYLVDHCQRDLGVAKDAIIHTAQALIHDLVPAARAGLTSAWIERGVEFKSAMGGRLDDHPDLSFSWRFRTLGDMAAAVEADAVKSA